MKYIVLSVYDRAACAFGRPIFAAAVGAAVRSFIDEVNRVSDDNPMSKHPKDFDLFKIAEFDDQSGLFSASGAPEVVAHGGQMQVNLQDPPVRLAS